MKIVEGTVIQSTLRTEDLLPALIRLTDALVTEMEFDAKSLTDENLKLQEALRTTAIRALTDEIEKSIESQPSYFESEEAQEDLNQMFDMLDDITPEGYYFGALPGDEADFGFWKY